MKYSILLVFSMFLGLQSLAQKKAEVTFTVDGICGMCEERIEEAYDTKGVVMADYDLHNKKLTVVYKTKHYPDILDLHRIATAIGHDTDKLKASDEAYANLHGCCKYREGGEHKCSGDHDHDHDDE